MGRIEIRDFDGDVEGLREMAYATLLEERGDKGWLDLNRPEIARHLFADVPDPRFLVAAYDGAKLVAFVANLPRLYRLNGAIYKGVMPTMLVARKEYRGAVIYLMAECLRRNAEFGADLAVSLVERGYRSWRLFEEYLKSRYRIERVRTLYALARGVDLGGIAESQRLGHLETTAVRLLGAARPIPFPDVSGTVRPYVAADLPQVLALTQRFPDHDCLVRVFGEESLARRLQAEGIAFTLVYERAGRVQGFVNFTAHEVISARSRGRWAWVDFLFWDGLSARERQALLAGLWQAGRDAGCIGILHWDRGYASTMPLFRSRFVPYPLFVDVNVWVFNPNLSLRGVRKIVDQVT